MVVSHGNVDTSKIKQNLERSMHINPIKGHVEMSVLYMFYKIFSWLYRGFNIEAAFVNNTSIDNKIISLLNILNVQSYINGSISESSIVFYKRISNIISIRDLKKEKLSFVANNKYLIKEDFKVDSLYNAYKGSLADIPKDFILFDTIFKNDIASTTTYNKKISDIFKAANIVDLVRPDLSLKAARKNLKVKDVVTIKKKKKVLYVFQDCTYSMKMYSDKLIALKAFILDKAVCNNFTVNWIEAGEFIVSDKMFNKDNYSEAFEFSFKYNDVNYSKIFEKDAYKNKNIVIITDGTDDFNFDFKSVTQKLNMVTFNNNYKLKNKIGEYGKYYIF